MKSCAYAKCRYCWADDATTLWAQTIRHICTPPALPTATYTCWWTHRAHQKFILPHKVQSLSTPNESAHNPLSGKIWKQDCPCCLFARQSETILHKLHAHLGYRNRWRERCYHQQQEKQYWPQLRCRQHGKHLRQRHKHQKLCRSNRGRQDEN